MTTVATETPDVPELTKERLRRTVATLRTELDTAAANIPATRVRDVVLSWLTGKGMLQRGSSAADANWRADDALRRAADLAHRETGHIGRLDMCDRELCRALADAGAE